MPIASNMITKVSIPHSTDSTAYRCKNTVNVQYEINMRLKNKTKMITSIISETITTTILTCTKFFPELQQQNGTVVVKTLYQSQSHTPLFKSKFRVRHMNRFINKTQINTFRLN